MAKPTADTEVVVVGSGPNGLAAAIEMVRGGFRVSLLEAAATIGGGTRTLELTLPGYRHDVARLFTRFAPPPRFSALSRSPVTAWSGFTRRPPWRTLLMMAPQSCCNRKSPALWKPSTLPTGKPTNS
jgi:phytoene dehydrogenase-like protein